jgi:metal-sulfur cluster biosynthetic enzyme
MLQKEQVIDVLKQCFDPEIPIDLWNLGLIYNIEIHEKENDMHDVDITMSLTTPGCSMGGYMADDIKVKLQGLPNVEEARVQVTFDPAWTPQMMTDEARQRLGFKPQEEPKEEKKDWE